MRSLIIIVVLVLTAVAGVKWSLSARQAPAVKKQSEPVLSVRTVNAALRPHRPVQSLVGVVEALDYSTLTMPVETDVLSIAVREGDSFIANQSLISLDQRELEYTLQGQTASLDGLAVQLSSVLRNRSADRQRLQEIQRLTDLAEQSYERSQSLAAQDVLSITRLEESEKSLLQRRLDLIAMRNTIADYDTQEKRLESQRLAAEAQWQQTRLQLEYSEVRAPFDGRVTKVHTSIGARPARGTALIDIFDPRYLRLRVALPQRYLTSVNQAGAVQALLIANGESLTLSFSGLEPKVEAGNSSVNAFFALPAGDWVLGSVHDILLELPAVDAVAVPVDAVYNDRFIYRIGLDNRTELVECQRLGLTRNLDEQIEVILDCPKMNQGEAIVANQLPGLLGGVLVTVVSVRP